MSRFRAYRIASLILLLGALACLSGFRKASYKTGPEIMEEVADRHKANTELELIKLVVVDEDANTQVREMLSVFAKDGNGEAHHLIRLLSPSDVKGITLLTNDATSDEPEQWFYMPALGQARQIKGENRSGYFMGSDFTYEDLRNENTTEHEYHRLQDDELNGAPVYVVMAAPANVDIQNAIGYANRLLYIDKETYNVHRVEFYEENNKEPIKVLEADEYALVDDAERPARIRMDNRTNNTYSVMTLLESKLNAPVDMEVFDPKSLESWSPETDQGLLAQFGSDNG